MRFSCPLLLLVTFGLVSSAAEAHYLWIAIDKKTGDHGQANVYFEEGPAAGDGHYLDPFIENGKAWIRTGEKPEEVKLAEIKTKGKRWMSGALPKDGPRCVSTSFKFGVYRYGKTDVLLNYYARNIDVKTNAELKQLESAKHLKLHIVPTVEDSTVTLQVMWQGKPATNCEMRLIGPKFRKRTQTDENGQVTFKAETPGVYRMRTTINEPDKSGTDGGKEYSLTRHHSSLIINLPLK